MPVFISWSGERSRHVASALSSFLEVTVPGLRVWMSQHSIEPGTRWEDTLRRVLDASQYGVLCLTEENLTAPWLMFEAGSLAKNIDKARVVPYFLGVTAADLEPPLGLFQGLNADEEGTWQLVQSAGATLPEPIDEATLRAAFAAAWPAFSNSIAPIRDAASPVSNLELQRDRERAQSFGSRVQGAWFERIEGEGIGLFRIAMDARHNSVRVEDGSFYDEKGQFTAEYRSAIARIDERAGREGIVYLRECYREGRDTWFHGYGDMWFTGSREAPYESGRGTFYDGDLNDPRKVVRKRVELRRISDARAIEIVEKGSDSERRALAQRTLNE